MALTNTAIKNAKAKDKPYRLTDEKGLCLEVRPEGGKWWRLRYRFGGKEKMLSLGTFPEVSLAEARDARDDARRLIAKGEDPSDKRKEEKRAEIIKSEHSFEAVARGWLRHRAEKWSERTQTIARASLELHVFPTLGAKYIGDIRPADVRDLVQSIDRQGAGETAGRVFQRLRSIFRYTLAHEIVATDPTYALKPAEILRPRAVQHRAHIPEQHMPDFLRKLDKYEGDPVTLAAMNLLILTAVRPGELRGARWAEIDSERSQWRIPAERMKMKTPHIVPLSRQALALLERVKTITGDDALVFASPYYPGKALSENTLNSALARMGYKGNATAHGFRSLFSTVANEAGWNRDVIERQLAHQERNEVRAAYNRAEYLAERTKLMQWWADQVDKMRGQSSELRGKTAPAGSR